MLAAHNCECLMLVVLRSTWKCWCLQVATSIVASMLALEAIDETQDIQIYINSQGKLMGQSSPCHFMSESC